MSTLYQNYLALDLELNQPSNKIIQVGIAIGSMAKPDHYFKLSWYVNPCESINPEITSLTGITDANIADSATPIDEIAEQISDLSKMYNCFVNPVTWGGGDSKELLDLFRNNGVEFKHFGRRWIDVKTIHQFIRVSKDKSFTGGLASAMGDYKLSFWGKQHRAGDDAANTLRLYFKLLERQTSLNNLVHKAKELV